MLYRMFHFQKAVETIYVNAGSHQLRRRISTIFEWSVAQDVRTVLLLVLQGLFKIEGLS